jgi:hypothetical protein
MTITQQTTIPSQMLTDLVDGLEYCLEVIHEAYYPMVKEQGWELKLEDRDYLNQLTDLVEEIKAELQSEPTPSG